MLWAILGLGALIVYQNRKSKTAAASVAAAPIISGQPIATQPMVTTTPDAWGIGDVIYPSVTPSPGADVGGLGVMQPLGAGGGGVDVWGARAMMDRQSQSFLAWVAGAPSLFSAVENKYFGGKAY